jgi:hypothetical protein
MEPAVLGHLEWPDLVFRGGDDGQGWRPGAGGVGEVGSVTRSGVVAAVDGRLISVRWDAGSESVFVPSAGSLRVTDHESAAREPDSS